MYFRKQENDCRGQTDKLYVNLSIYYLYNNSNSDNNV